MRKLILAAFLLGGCQTTMDRAPEVWYSQAEIVCYDEACSACRGHGHIGCRPCRGHGEVDCRRCSNGRVRCTRCGGSGMYKDKKCSRCGGDGVQRCSTCGGDGEVTCGRCSGKGRLQHLRPLKVTEPKPEGEDIWPPVPRETP